MFYVDETIKNTYRVPQPEGRGAYIRLDQNENPDGVPRWLFDSVMEKVTPEFLAIYPEETKPTEKYAKMLGLEKNNVTLTAGSSVGMGYVIKTFGEPGKTILTVTPSFAMYEVYAKMIGMKVHQLQYENDFTYRVEKTLEAINEDTGIVVLVNPNMPVGNIYPKEEIIAIIEKANAAGVPVMSSMGAGNKINASLFEVADIYDTSVCPLAKVMRHECKKRGIKHLKVVYSKEKPIRPIEDMSISCRTNCVCPPGTARKCTERRDIPGSTAFAPSVAGLIIAGEVINDLTGKKSIKG